MLLLALACARPCSDCGPSGDPTGSEPPPPPPPPSVSLEAPAAFDPLRGPAVVRVIASEDALVEVELDGAPFGAGEGTFTLDWDGAGPLGPHRLVARASSPSGEGLAEAPIATVRPAFLSATLEDDAREGATGPTATREPLWFPRDRAGAADPSAGVLQLESDPVTRVDAADRDGVPTALPAVAEDPGGALGIALARRPDGAEPAAFVAGSRPILALTSAADSPALGPTALDLVAVDASAVGWSVLAGSPLDPGSPLVLQADEPLPDTVGVSDLEVVVAFSSGGAPIGEQVVPLRIFRVAGRSAFPDPAPEYRPWAVALAQALPGIEGTPAEPEAVADALVDWVYFDLGLRYDTVAGASAYTDYRRFDWSQPHFRFTEFLLRLRGSVINCSDAAMILGAYTNQVGVPLDALVLDPQFQLNPILAIGGTAFDRCPFGNLGCGFSYHAVTTVPDSSLVWDATLAVDGDADPREAPQTALLVQGLAGADYVAALVRSGAPRFHSEARETLE